MKTIPYTLKMKILIASAALNITFGIIFIHAMLTSSNGGISYLPDHSRLADINFYHEGWIEGILFLVIGIAGLVVCIKEPKGLVEL